MAIGDAAVGRFGVTPEELAVELDLAKYRRGIGRARVALAALDGRSESVGESRSRLLLARSALPNVATQGNVYARDGRFLGRVDFYLPGRAVVGEFDGRGKYLRDLQPGREPGDVVIAEKLREDALRDAAFRLHGGPGQTYGPQCPAIGFDPRWTERVGRRSRPDGFSRHLPVK